MRSGRSAWEDLITPDEAAALDPGRPASLDRRPDILIVGGGMVGVATAVTCQQAGLGRVVLLEGGCLGDGASGGAAGLLLPEAHHGTDPAPFVALGRSSLAAWRELDLIAPDGVGLMHLDWLGLDPQPSDLAADPPPTAQPLGEDDVRRLVPALAPPRAGLLIPDQGRVNPLGALARLSGRLLKPGAVVTGVKVVDVVVRSDRIVAVETTMGRLNPGAVIFALGGPPEFPHLRLDIAGETVKGHLLVTQPVPFSLPATVAPLATQLEDGRLLSAGTLDVDTTTLDVQEDVINATKASLDTAFSVIKGIPISHRWCCFRPAVRDRQPVIDQLPGLVNAWVTCGHFRTGILMAPATGRVLADWISTDHRPAEADAFRLDRAGLASGVRSGVQRGVEGGVETPR